MATIREMEGTTDADPRTYRVLAEIERALTRGPLGDAVLADLVPVPRAAERTERGEARARFTVGLHAELEVAFGLESADSGRWLTEEYAQERSVAAGYLLGTALTRLHHRTDGATVYRDGPLGSEVYLVRHRDGLDASRLLLTPLWEKVAAATNAPLVFAAPSRDRVYAAPSDQPHSIERLFERVREDWSTRPLPISTRLWVWRRARLEPWHPTPDVSRETL